jgi:Domain of unknown function (DUF222)/HNH endonuclease
MDGEERQSHPGWGSLTPDERLLAIGQMERLIQAARRVQLRVIAAHDRSEDWKDDGAKSMADWLCHHLGLGRSTAPELVATSHRLEELPALGGAFGDGSLSWDQLQPVLRMATPESDAFWAEAAPRESAGRLGRLARRSRPLSPEEDEEARRRRFLRLWWNREGDSLRLEGRLPREQGAALEAALMRRASQEPKLPDGTWAPLDWRLADALASTASAALAADPDSDRATVLVTTDLETLTVGEGLAHVGNDHDITADTARRLACDCRMQLVVEDGEGRVVGVGRTTRTIPPWLDRLLKRRDQGCRFPGCRRVRWTNGHHIQFWSEGGPTDLGNLVTLCGSHHELVHEKGWAIEGDPNGEIRFLRPDGRQHQPWFEPLCNEFRTRLLDPLLPPAALIDTG